MDKKIPWSGGDCPVDPETLVCVWWEDGDCEVERAGDWNWQYSDDPGDNIIAYEVWS